MIRRLAKRQTEAGVDHRDRVCDEQPLALHPQHACEDARRRVRAPRDSHNSQNVADQAAAKGVSDCQHVRLGTRGSRELGSLKCEDNVDHAEEDEGKEAVAEDRGCAVCIDALF